MKGAGSVAEDIENQKTHDSLVIQEIKRMNDEWVSALETRDLPSLNRIMADDFIFTHPMEGDDKEQFIADVESGDVSVKHMGRENVMVRVYGDTAVLSCRDTASWLYKGRDFTGVYKTLHVYARRDGRWQLVAIQSCHYS
jgi:ketosteroid isomerase-like protein